MLVIILDEAQFSRFKITFHSQINLLFHNLVEYAEILSDELNPFLASVLISYTTGIEAYITESNSTFYESELHKAKTLISTNGLCLIRDINFYNVDNSLSLDRIPKEVRDIRDFKSLIPSLETYFRLHPHFHYKNFLGDSSFDGDETSTFLYEKMLFQVST